MRDGKLMIMVSIFLIISCRSIATGDYARSDKKETEVSVITECPSGKQYNKKAKTKQRKKIIYEENTLPKYRTR